MVFPIVGGTQDTGYEISNSLRFDGSSSYLYHTHESGNKDTFTFSSWIKFGDLDNDTSADVLFSVTNTGYVIIRFEDKQLDYLDYDGSDVATVSTNRLFRDVSAWYHIVVAIDMTQSTDSNRVKLYVNGSQESSFATATYQPQNQDTVVNTAAEHRIGRESGNYFSGYMADVNFIDGTAYAASDFGETNDNGVWIPKNPGVTYGTNGYKLEFKQTGTSANASGIGADTSGQGNHHSVSGLAAIDVTEDTPTNNFCTLNPLDPIQGAAYSEGNCKVVTNSSNRNYVTGTFGLTSGKWYWEAKLTAVTSNQTDQAFFGIADLDDRGANSTGQSLGDRENEVGWHQEEGKFQRNNSFSDGSTAGDSASWGIGDICAIALDADNNRVTIAKNGQWADGSGNADESNPTSFVSYNASTMTPAMGEGGGGTEATWECNFGNPIFSISSGNSDANGYGNFEYAVPSGYYSLCTKNLAQYG